MSAFMHKLLGSDRSTSRHKRPPYPNELVSGVDAYVAVYLRAKVKELQAVLKSKLHYLDAHSGPDAKAALLANLADPLAPLDDLLRYCLLTKLGEPTSRQQLTAAVDVYMAHAEAYRLAWSVILTPCLIQAAEASMTVTEDDDA